MEDELEGACEDSYFISSREHMYPFHTTLRSVQDHRRW